MNPCTCSRCWGGLAAGIYTFETLFTRTREGARPWLVPLVVVVLFVIGTIAATTHVTSMSRAMSAFFGGTANFGSGMVREVAVAGVFLILALIDLIIVFVKKNSPFGLRVIATLFAVVCMIMMGVAYIDIYGVPVWSEAPATLLLFLAGALAMGAAAYAVLSGKGYKNKGFAYLSIVINILLAIGIGLEIAAFQAHGLDPLSQVAALIVAPVASIALVAASLKRPDNKTLVLLVCILSIVGVAIARYAFYAACMV